MGPDRARRIARLSRIDARLMYGPIRDPPATPWALRDPVGTRRASGGPLAAPSDPASQEPPRFGRPAAPIGAADATCCTCATLAQQHLRNACRGRMRCRTSLAWTGDVCAVSYLCLRWDDRSGRTGLSSHTCGMTAVIPQVSWADLGPTWADLGSTWAAGPVPEARKWPRHARGWILKDLATILDPLRAIFVDLGPDRLSAT